MTFEELVEMAESYAAKYKCSFDVAIDDLEFDGPQGSHGPSQADLDALRKHFKGMKQVIVYPNLHHILGIVP